MIVAVAAFATTFAQQRVTLGNYPILFHLKKDLHFGREQVSEFFLWATFAWNVKPLAGVLTDAFPIFGSRRRLYLVLGGLLAGGSWALLDVVRDDYPKFLVVSIALNAGLVLASTAMGGLQVEAGQAYGIPGRVSSLRQVVMSVSQIGAPLLGGWLAQRAFGYTAAVGAFVMIALAVFALINFKEKPVPKPGKLTDEEIARPRYKPSLAIGLGMFAIGTAATVGVLTKGMLNVGFSLFALLGVFVMVLTLAMAKVHNPVLFKAQGQLTEILRSRTLWLAVGMLFLVYTVPGLNTALTYRQSDVLKFPEEMIGTLASIEGAAGVVFAIVYAIICSRFNLRTLLIGSIALNAAATLLFLRYNHSTAYVVHAATGAMTVMSELSLMDLAVRSTPKGCEALGFALMISVRNFGIALSDVVGSKLMDRYHLSFSTLVLVNAGTTAGILVFVPLLPHALMSRKEGESA
jgi:predicted MFS family arabinose efflux permease